MQAGQLKLYLPEVLEKVPIRYQLLALKLRFFPCKSAKKNMVDIRKVWKKLGHLYGFCQSFTNFGSLA